MTVRKSDITDSDVIDSEELASTGSTAYLSNVTVVSTTSSTKAVVVNGIFLTRDLDNPVEVGDRVAISGNAAAGIYTITSITNETTFVVSESILDATGGLASFRHPPGSTKIGIDSSSAAGISTKTLQGFINGHRSLRELIHFINDGPAEGFASGSFKEILPLGSAFPTQVIWWTSSSKVEKIVDLTITRDGTQKPTSEIWKIYDTDGTTALATVTDSITYSGPFEKDRTRTLS